MMGKRMWVVSREIKLSEYFISLSMLFRACLAERLACVSHSAWVPELAHMFG